MRQATQRKPKWWQNPTIQEKAMAYDLITIGGFVTERKAVKALWIAHQTLPVPSGKNANTAQPSPKSESSA